MKTYLEFIRRKYLSKVTSTNQMIWWKEISKDRNEGKTTKEIV